MVIDVHKCARCHGTHEKLLFKKFTNPIRVDYNDFTFIVYRFWAMCPNFFEPIIMHLEDTSES